MSFDPLNLLLLAVALVVFWRLRSVLGTRTGSERPPLDPLGSRTDDGQKPTDANNTVIRFPQHGESEPPKGPAPEATLPIWTGFAQAGTPLAESLERLALADGGFSPREFIEGAKAAYEMIIESFAKGEKSTLKNLLSREVFDGFSRAIDERERAGQKVEQRFVGISRAAIEAVSLAGSKAAITVEFVSELISATYGKNGEIVDGDPGKIKEVTDVWTFERDVTSRDPNWKLVATQTPT